MEVEVYGVQIKTSHMLLSIWEHSLYGRGCNTIKPIFFHMSTDQINK